jgi:hypothetical protein
LEISKREINAKTDIAFEYVPIKKGRKVDAIRFVISRNKHKEDAEETGGQPVSDASSVPEDQKELAQRLAGYGMKEPILTACLRDHPPEIVAGTLAELDRRKARGEKIDNKAGWLWEAIRHGWFADSIEEEARRERLKQKHARREARRETLETAIKKIKADYRDYTKTAIAQYIEMLAPEDREALETAFRKFVEDQPGGGFAEVRFDNVAEWYTNPYIRVAALQYLPKNREDFLLLSVADFAKQQGIRDFEGMEREFKELEG